MPIFWLPYSGHFAATKLTWRAAKGRRYNLGLPDMPHCSRPKMVFGGSPTHLPTWGGLFTTHSVDKTCTATPGLEPAMVIKRHGCVVLLAMSSACWGLRLRCSGGTAPPPPAGAAAARGDVFTPSPRQRQESAWQFPRKLIEAGPSALQLINDVIVMGASAVVL